MSRGNFGVEFAEFKQLIDLGNAITAQKTKIEPKKKFSFKSRSTTTPSSSTNWTPPPPTLPESRALPFVEDGITLSTSNAYLSIPADSHPSNIRLLSMSNSVVNLLHPRRHATLQAEDLTNCLILLSTINGAAHLTNLTNCIVVLKCHQVAERGC